MAGNCESSSTHTSKNTPTYHIMESRIITLSLIHNKHMKTMKPHVTGITIFPSSKHKDNNVNGKQQKRKFETQKCTLVTTNEMYFIKKQLICVKKT